MLTSYPTPGREDGSLPASKVYWIDLLRPTEDERTHVEDNYHLQLPSREELSEVELSSRVSEENGVLFLNMPTVTYMSGIDHPPSPLGFVLSKDILVTIRYTELRAFETVAKKCAKDGAQMTSLETFSALVDEMVDLSADLLEGVATEMDAMSRRVFSRLGRQRLRRPPSNDELGEALSAVGNAGERLSRIRDSILGLERIVPYVAGAELNWIPQETRIHLATPRNDLASLNEYQTHLSDKVQFLLDAVLGFINIKQSDIFQVLTVISVVGIPPTLVASMYGMNFKNMPELSWAWGYQYGLALIFLSAVVPLLWFKWRKWV
jgi:magnesium transporter